MPRDTKHTPMLWVLIPLAMGICIATHLSPPLYISAIIFIISTLLLITTQQAATIYPIIFGVGLLTTQLHNQGGDNVDYSTPNSTIILKVTANNKATIVAQRDDSGQWHRCRGRAIVWHSDTLEYNRVTAEAYISKIDPSKSRYQAAMHNMGYRSTVTITKLLTTKPQEHLPLKVRINRWGYQKLSELGLNRESFASAAAMTLGRKESLSKEITEGYQRTGAAHMLAISGLHMTIVMLIISALTYMLPLIRNGHIYANIIAIIMIWLFAFMAGLSSSVLRSACMLSMLHIARLSSRHYNGTNSLLTAAVLILCFDPAALYNIGFQLSFIAVWVIITIGAPLLTLVEGRSKLLNYLVGSVIISTIATTVTIPLLAYSFGYVSLLSPLSTLILAPTLIIIVLTTCVWIMIPIGAAAPIFRVIIESTVSFQNFTITKLSALNWGYHPLDLNLFELCIAYAIIAVIALPASHFINAQLKKDQMRAPDKSHR